ncbi:MAG: hypothetical protein GY913_27040 [Proteobacteria bacterium]|nr:hypothetical protein [Pseudomonadota bacterium]MCP4920571.1 hypothetical protein [Pseudomonadota bacterium]
MTPEAFAEEATKALNNGDADQALEWMERAVAACDEPRPDLEHAMGVILMQTGKPVEARDRFASALELAWKANVPGAFLAHIHVALAAAQEDLDDPMGAFETYDKLYDLDAQHEARAGHGHLLFAMGRHAEGLAEMKRFQELSKAPDEHKEGAAQFAASVAEFTVLLADHHVEPRDFLKAHREMYVEFFDEKAAEMAEQGWMAEPARMTRADDGRLLPIIPEGARPYAAVRVDLASPEGGAGQIGDQPMIVALGGFQPLAQAPVVFKSDVGTLPVYVSSQCPWDQLPITVVIGHGNAEQILEPIFADWYVAGFEGAFGTSEGGRFHYISDPELFHDDRAVRFTLDMGRADLRAIDALLDGLETIHRVNGIDQVLFGRGHVTPPETDA